MADKDFDQKLANSCEADIAETRRITPEATNEVRHIVLRIAEPSFRYQEGQTIGVLVPGPHPFGNSHHHRYYSIANARNLSSDEEIEIEILVRRCSYIDEVSGEEYPGIASNYLCDAKPGDKITITGPYRSSFNIPQDENSNLVMIGTGTGVAPFRSFTQRIYQQKKGWKGQVRLFYGAKTGMDLLYMNDLDNDLTNYYDEASFKAFQAIGDNPFSKAENALERTLEENTADAWNIIKEPNTHLFLAGLIPVSEALDKAMSQQAGSPELWAETKQRMMDENRWSEMLYR